MLVKASSEYIAADVMHTDCSRRELLLVSKEWTQPRRVLGGREWCRLFGYGEVVGSSIDGAFVYFVTMRAHEPEMLVRWDRRSGEITVLLEGCVRDNISVNPLPSARGVLVPIDCAESHRREELIIVDQEKQIRPLENIPGTRVLYPAASPDGEWIAYARQTLDASDRFQVFETSLRGREERFIGEGIWPSYSPDGGLLAFISFGIPLGSAPRVHILDRKSGEGATIPITVGLPNGPILWSENSSVLHFSILTGNKSTIWEYHIEMNRLSPYFPKSASE
jgi:hypothetical protein